MVAVGGAVAYISTEFTSSTVYMAGIVSRWVDSTFSSEIHILDGGHYWYRRTRSVSQLSTSDWWLICYIPRSWLWQKTRLIFQSRLAKSTIPAWLTWLTRVCSFLFFFIYNTRLFMTHSPNNVRNETEKEEENGRTTSTTRYKKGSWAVWKDWGPFFSNPPLSFFLGFLRCLFVPGTGSSNQGALYKKAAGKRIWSDLLSSVHRTAVSQFYAMAIQQVDIPFKFRTKFLRNWKQDWMCPIDRLDYFDQRRAGRYWIADRIFW